MLGPFATASRYIAIHQVSLLSHAACTLMSTTTTTTTRDRGDRYGPMEWAQPVDAHILEMEDFMFSYLNLHNTSETALYILLKRVVRIK